MWYAVENQIAYGFRPADAVSLKKVEPATRKRPGSVAIDLVTGDRNMHRSESIDRSAADPKAGAA